MSSGVRFDSVAQLPQWAQKQLVKKMHNGFATPHPSPAATPSPQGEGFGAQNKYHAVKTESRGIRFDSKKEARRFEELMMLLQAGKIRDLKLQHDFTLQEAYTTTEGVRVRAIRFRADFCYEEPDGNGGWRKIVEDVKSKATKTRVYAIKKKLMQDVHGVCVREYE